MELSRTIMGGIVALCATVAAANAADRWEEAAGGAVAILPAPTQATGILGGSLYCAEQKWSFLFRAEGLVAAAFAKIGLEGETLEHPATVRPGSVEVAIPVEMIDLLRSGTRMRVEAGDAKATFNLRNSIKVLDAIAPRCSQIDMSAFREVVLAEIGPAVDAVRGLFEEEIKLFRAATGKEPAIAAVQIDLDASRQLLFGSLCGSTRYYGESGCTMGGWAAGGFGWLPVYATEGQRLYLDEKTARDGWPGLATLPVVNGTEPIHWIWNGSAYQIGGVGIVAGESQ